MKLTALSIKRPKLTIVGMILFILLGFVSLTNLPLQLFPEINPPVGAVVSSYPGASPEEVEDKVTKPLEESLSTLPGLNRMTSSSEEGMALVLLEFSWTSTIDEVEQDIITAMNQVSLADGVNSPRFMKFDPSMLGMNQMAITSNGQKVTDFQDDVDDFKTELERIKGIANVSSSGGLTERYEVSLNQKKMTENNLTQDQIAQLIQAHEIALPGGTIETDKHTLTTRILNSIDGKEGLETLEIAEGLTLSDIAEIKLNTAKQTAITRANQKPALQLSAMKESDANTVQVSTLFSEKLDELLDKSEYENLSVITLYDEGEFIQESIDSVTSALVLGGLFAMIVLFLFLRNLKTPLIIGISIPFSVIVTFGFLYFTGVSLNIMTLGGLALGIGMLVDNAIVVIENIYRHLSMGKDPKIAANDGTKEVGGAITASTLTTIVVFLPIVFISGIVGNIFMEFALAIAFSLIASLGVALTVVPMIASRVLTAPSEDQEIKRQQSASMKLLDRSIKWALGHRFLTTLIVIALLAVGGLGLARTGVDFLPESDQGSFMINVSLENGAKLDETLDTVKKIEDILDKESDVKDYMAAIGSAEEGAAMGGPSGSNDAMLFVSMKNADQRSRSTVDFVEDVEKEIKGVNLDADISLSSSAAIGGGEANTIVFTLSDKNKARLDEAIETLQADLEDEKDIREVETSLGERSPEMQVLINEKEAQKHGLTPGEIAQIVSNVTRGETVTSIQSEDSKILDVVVKYADEDLANKEDLENLMIPKHDSSHVSLKHVATIEEGDGPTVINRLNQEPSVEFTVTYSTDTNLNSVAQLIREVIDDADLEDSTSYAFTGEQELLEDSIQSLAFAFILALLFIYLVMAGQFESFKYPFVVMLSVPLMVIGVMLALTVTNTALSVTVFIGIIVLAGIVVNNGIVLIDYINQLKERGMSTHDALVESVKRRTRPILMTALTTILGTLPLALGIGEGAEIQQPMGIAVIGGLISSTFLTLFFVPVLYSLFDKETRRTKKYVTPDGQVITPPPVAEEPITATEAQTEEPVTVEKPVIQEENSKQEEVTPTVPVEEVIEEQSDEAPAEQEEQLETTETVEEIEERDERDDVEDTTEHETPSQEEDKIEEESPSRSEQQAQDTRDDLSRDDIINLLEQILQQSKNDKDK